MVIAADDYPFLEIAGSTLVFFLGIVWIWMVCTILVDLFRRHDITGLQKAAWVVLLLILPILGALTYVVVEHEGMADRTTENLQHEAMAIAQARASGAGVSNEAARIQRGAMA